MAQNNYLNNTLAELSYGEIFDLVSNTRFFKVNLFDRVGSFK